MRSIFLDALHPIHTSECTTLHCADGDGGDPGSPDVSTNDSGRESFGIHVLHRYFSWDITTYEDR